MSIYNEPDWSSLSLAELFEKAQEFAKKVYGNSRRHIKILLANSCARHRKRSGSQGRKAGTARLFLRLSLAPGK